MPVKPMTISDPKLRGSSTRRGAVFSSPETSPRSVTNSPILPVRPPAIQTLSRKQGSPINRYSAANFEPTLKESPNPVDAKSIFDKVSDQESSSDSNSSAVFSLERSSEPASFKDADFGLNDKINQPATDPLDIESLFEQEEESEDSDTECEPRSRAETFVSGYETAVFTMGSSSESALFKDADFGTSDRINHRPDLPSLLLRMSASTRSKSKMSSEPTVSSTGAAERSDELSKAESPRLRKIRRHQRSDSRALEHWKQDEILKYCSQPKDLGEAWKKSGRRAPDEDWKRRRFEAHAGLIRYYKKGLRSKEAVKGNIHLADASMEIIPDKFDGRLFCFDLYDKIARRIFLISVETSQDLEVWRMAVHNHVHFCNLHPDKVDEGTVRRRSSASKIRSGFKDIFTTSRKKTLPATLRSKSSNITLERTKAASPLTSPRSKSVNEHKRVFSTETSVSAITSPQSESNEHYSSFLAQKR